MQVIGSAVQRVYDPQVVIALYRAAFLGQNRMAREGSFDGLYDDLLRGAIHFTYEVIGLFLLYGYFFHMAKIAEQQGSCFTGRAGSNISRRIHGGRGYSKGEVG